VVAARPIFFCGAFLAAAVFLLAAPLLVLFLSFAADLLFGLLVPALVVTFFEDFLLLVLLVFFIL
ncbi:MAG: hypothetical protein V3T35_13635, partial [Spirochaetia bacterium]